MNGASTALRVFTVAVLALIGGAAVAREITLADKGQAQCVIVAPAGWANDAAIPEGLPPASRPADLLHKGA